MLRLLFVGLLLTGSSAFAHRGVVRAYAGSMTCAQAANLVAQHGAVIIYTGPSLYDRYVAHQGFCSRASGETTVPAWIPTRDTRQCFVGYTCEETDRD